MRDLARRTPELIAKSQSAEAWEATSKLRRQFIATSMDAMPARVAAAKAEYASLRAKVAERAVTVNDVAIGASRVLEFYCFYLVGRAVGRRQLSP